MGVRSRATTAAEQATPRGGAALGHLVTWLGLAAAIAALSALHRVTDPSRVLLHSIYPHLSYVPIILAAYWYGVAGGLAAAVVSAAAFIPHIRTTWAAYPAFSTSLYGEIFVFHLLGVSVGLMASLQRRVTERYRTMAEALERANREIRESQEHLRRADRLSALGEIAAGLAHEIRNPLASVKGALEIVGARVPPGSPEAEFAHIAGKELARLDGMVTEFLTYARPREPELRQAMLQEVIEHVVRLLGPEAERARVTVEIEQPGSVPSLPIDPEQMAQVIFNVVLNAIQASPAGARVRVRESVDGARGIVEVIDEGPGIAPEHAPRIFDPFFTTRDRGTGLGLAISHRVVTAHRGMIDALPASGRGTRVRIALPLSAGAPSAAPQPAAPTSV